MCLHLCHDFYIVSETHMFSLSHAHTHTLMYTFGPKSKSKFYLRLWYPYIRIFCQMMCSPWPLFFSCNFLRRLISHRKNIKLTSSLKSTKRWKCTAQLLVVSLVKGADSKLGEPFQEPSRAFHPSPHGYAPVTGKKWSMLDLFLLP